MESERSCRDNGLIKAISVTRKNSFVFRSSRSSEAPFLSIISYSGKEIEVYQCVRLNFALATTKLSSEVGKDSGTINSYNNNMKFG